MCFVRYLVICHAMKAQVISTPGRAKRIVVAVWILAFLTSAPFAYFSVRILICCGVEQ